LGSIFNTTVVQYDFDEEGVQQPTIVLGYNPALPYYRRQEQIAFMALEPYNMRRMTENETIIDLGDDVQDAEARYLNEVRLAEENDEPGPDLPVIDPTVIDPTMYDFLTYRDILDPREEPEPDPNVYPGSDSD
jgi:hypothetical protein